MIKTYDQNIKNKFPHKFDIKRLDVESSVEMIAWLRENCGKYNQDYIYWGLKRSTTQMIFANSTEVHIKNEQDAFAFKLRWS